MGTTADGAPRRDEKQAMAMLQSMEREIETYPESTGEILMETAGELQRLGYSEHVLGLGRRIIADCPEDAGHGHLHRIEALFDLGRVDEAEQAMSELWELDTEARQVAPLIAELLESRDAGLRALKWADRPFREVLGPAGSAESIDDVDDFLSARTRADLRRRLGFTPDLLDEHAERIDPFQPLREMLDSQAPEDDENAALAALGFAESDPYPGGHRQAPGPVITSHIIRSDVMEAHAEGLLVGIGADEEITPDSYFREVELDRRKLRRETGFSKAAVVALTMAEIRAFAREEGIGAPTEGSRHDAVKAKYARGGDFPVWPPERNQPCWCASDRKYKKCCGRP